MGNYNKSEVAIIAGSKTPFTGMQLISLSHNKGYVKNGLDLLTIRMFNNNNRFGFVFYITF